MADLATLRIGVDSREVKTATNDLNALGNAAGNSERSLSKLTKTISFATLGAGFAMVVKRAVDFEKSMAEISTLVDTSVVSVNELSAAVREQSKAFGGDVQTQARALYQIISAGASDAATANNILTTANKLAAGGVTDVLTAADGLTSVLNAYGNKVAGATAVSDAMFVAMKGGKTTIAELSANLGAVAPLAAQMGISFDELTASTAALTKGGVSTSVAMTGLRAILATVAKPSKEATDLAAELGIEFNSAGLKAKGLAGFMEELKAKTGGSSDAMATLFGGVEALVPALALSGKAGQDLALIMEQMAVKAGATDEAAGKMAKTFAFQFGKALANVNDIVLTFGGIIQSTLLPALTFFNNNLAEIQATLKTLAFAIMGAVTAFIALKVAMGVQAIVAFIAQVYALVAGMGLANFATVAATFAINAFKAALASTGIGIVVIAIGALIGAMYSLSTAQAQARAETNALVGSLAGLAAARAANYGTELAKAKERVKELQKERDGLQAEADRTDAARSARFGLRPTDIKGGTGASKEVADLTKNIKEQNAAIANSEVVYKLANEEAKKAAELAKQNGGAVVASTNAEKDKTKETAKSTDALMDYYKGLVETGKYLGLTTEYEIQAAKATADGRVELAAKIIMQGKANEAAQLLIDNEKKRQDFIKGTLADLMFENSLIGMGVQEREKAIAVRALENAKIVEGTDAYKAYLDAVAAGSQGKVLDDQNKRIAALREEITLMGLSGDAAVLQAAKFAALASGLKEGTDAYEKFIAKATEEAALQKTVDGLQAIKDAMQEVKDMTFDIDLEGVFGNVGKAVGGLVNVYDDFAKRQKVLALAMSKDNKDEAGRRMAQQKSFRNEINLYGNLAASAKGFFKEKSVGYKIMQAAETAFRAFEFAMSLKSIAMKATETTATVVAEGTKTAAQTASGASKMFSQLGIYAFPIVAAMIGVMASLGGNGGSVPTPSIPDAEEMQAQQGAGSVLGDAIAKSDSINRAIEIMASNSNTDLEYSNKMLISLRSIQDNMANLSNNVAKQISVSGSMFDTSGQRLGSTGTGGFLGIGASSTTRSVQDLGIDISSSSIAEIIADGISGSTYQVIEQVKKKSGFFGLGGGTKTSYQTTTGSIDQDVRNSITGVIISLRQGLIDGADVIGLQGAQAILDAFEVNIGKISLSGLTGQEIEEQLNAIFSKVGDQMAGALLPSLTEMQKIGEGLFETFARVAREYQVVDVTLRSIGKEFGAVGIASVAARSALVQMFESIDQFVEQTNYFRDNFLTEAEKIAPITKAVGDELARLGLSSITTIDQFKNAVLGLDLTSTAGQQTYAALLQLAPAFKQVADYQAEIAKLQIDVAKTGVNIAKTGVDIATSNVDNAKASLAIQQQRVTMEIQLMEAQGNATEALAARRELELAAMDETLQGLRLQIYAAQDAKEASDDAAQAAKTAAEENARQVAAAEKLASDRRNLEIQLMEATGNASGALAAKRTLELAAMDESLRGLQRQIYAAQDAAIAAEKQAKAIEAATARNAQRRELEIKLLEAQGFAVEALAARRALELKNMDASLRSLQMQIWAAQAKAEEDAKAAQVLEDAANAMKQYQDALANVTQTVMDEINRLRGINTSSSSVLLKAQFATLTAQARTGNLDALGKLPELSRSIEEATLGTATSALEVARIRAWLDASLSETLASQGVSNGAVNATGSSLTFDGNSTASANAEQTSGELSNMSNVLYTALYQVAKNTGKSYELLDRWDGDGLPDIREDASDYY